MSFNFLRRQPNERDRAVADRLPPGQHLTEKWPVLHYGGVPKVNLATWECAVVSMYAERSTWTYNALVLGGSKTREKVF